MVTLSENKMNLIQVEVNPLDQLPTRRCTTVTALFLC